MLLFISCLLKLLLSYSEIETEQINKQVAGEGSLIKEIQACLLIGSSDKSLHIKVLPIKALQSLKLSTPIPQTR